MKVMNCFKNIRFEKIFLEKQFKNMKVTFITNNDTKYWHSQKVLLKLDSRQNI